MQHKNECIVPSLTHSQTQTFSKIFTQKSRFISKGPERLKHTLEIEIVVLQRHGGTFLSLYTFTWRGRVERGGQLSLQVYINTTQISLFL